MTAIPHSPREAIARHLLAWRHPRADFDTVTQATRNDYLDGADMVLAALRMEIQDGFVWAICSECGGNIFRHVAWSHEGGTPPQDYDASPLDNGSTGGQR